MLTIRHIEKPNKYENDGVYELIQPVTHVWRSDKKTIFAKAPDKEHPLQFGTGTVYVMNDNGKTVATYYLDK